MITLRDIKAAVCEVYGISCAELDGDSSARAIARPRQVGMYVARALTHHSLTRIGRSFGRDHTTVMHAIRNVDRLYVADPTVAAGAERVRTVAEIRR